MLKIKKSRLMSTKTLDLLSSHVGIDPVIEEWNRCEAVGVSRLTASRGSERGQTSLLSGLSVDKGSTRITLMITNKIFTKKI